MKPDAIHINEAGTEGLEKLLMRLQTVKKAEFLVGRHLLKEDAAKMSNEEFFKFTEKTIEELLPVYDVIIGRN